MVQQNKPIKPGRIYRKTFAFVLLKLAVGIICVMLSFMFLAVCYAGIRNQWSRPLIVTIFAIWILFTAAIYPIANRFGVYLIRAGHIAVIVETVKTGTIPDRPISYGIRTVRKRFPVTAAYFVAHKLVDKANREISKFLWHFASDIAFVLNLAMIDRLLSAYMKIAIGSIDDCCIGYTFANPKRGALQCACDGVVYYAANWKTMTKSAASTLGWAMLLCAVLIVIPITVILVSLFSVKALSLWVIPIILFAAYIGTAIKDAVVDSYIVCRMVSAFYDCVTHAEPLDDYYEELKATSGKFRNLCAAAKRENEERKKKKAKTGV